MIEDIRKVAEKIKEHYPNIYVDYEYLEKDNLYEIWYNKEELNNDVGFQEFVGKLICEYLYSKNIFNFFIDYNEEKSANLFDTSKIIYVFNKFYEKLLYDLSIKNISYKLNNNKEPDLTKNNNYALAA